MAGPLLVGDLMTSPVLTIRPHTRLPQIKTIMRERNIHRLPVVEHTYPIGIVTLGDVRNAFPSDIPLLHDPRQSRIERVCAADIMRTDLITIEPDVDIVTAAALLLHYKISGLPVVLDHQIVGMLTKSDLCRALIEGRLISAPQRIYPTRQREEVHVPAAAIDVTLDAAEP